MSADSFLSGQSSIWALPDGPNSQPLYLGCHGIGDITEPLGDITIKYCPDPSKAGAYLAKKSFRGEPGAITTSIETDLRRTADYLEDLGNCEVALFVHKVSCGRRDVFTNYDRSFILRKATISQRTVGNVASRSPDGEDETTQSFDISAQVLTRIAHLEGQRITVSEPSDITGITICGEDRCEGDCGTSQIPTDKMFASSAATTGSFASTADVLKSINKGQWSASASEPFSLGEDINGIVCFQMGRDTLRVLVARGTTDGGFPAEVAFTDDNGATWTNVDVGVQLGDFVANGHALFALDRYHIWLGTNSGYIYFSSDAGLTWTLQEAGIIAPWAVQGISFYSPQVGYSVYTDGTVARTTDGGVSWGVTTVSGCSGAKDIHAVSAYFAWVVGDDGKFYTHDSGTTWAQRDAIPTAAIDFYDDLVGITVGSAAQGVIYTTINGGFDWNPLTLISNSGYLDVRMISPKLAYATGKSNTGTGLLVKITPQV
jgi:hypothetical protein